jgi:hypothetical protein
VSDGVALLSASPITAGRLLAWTLVESSAVLTVCCSAAGETDAAGVDAAAELVAALELPPLEDELLLLLLDPQPATKSAPARTEQVAADASIRCPRNRRARLSADIVDMPSFS